jgi:cytidine deaminase
MLKVDPKQLIKDAAEASKKAYAPYSKFHVGAVALAANGRIFIGCNVENASFGLTNCAERTALFSAIAAGHREFAAMAIVADGEQLPFPCGACRQVMAEFCKAGMPVFVASASDLDAFQQMSLGDLLPKTFRF